MNVYGEYDYTTNASTNGPSKRQPDNVYNKLKIDRPGYYDHVGTRVYIFPKASRDYDISTAYSLQKKDVSSTVTIFHSRWYNTYMRKWNQRPNTSDWYVINGIDIKLPA
ncbi:hypothetical protein DPMN_077053 [Dreissena polymorpha]|uniref:Uncharacterized protein n=1 Tax=Dreissena polymorpha TaxID=45954 RepID=A0A9D3YJS4_DREPO|nr:hypothetical protein DPMN_077053 [Dreissena polymorpha]